MPIARLIYVSVGPDQMAEAERIWKHECAPLMIQQPGCLSEELLKCLDAVGEYISYLNQRLDGEDLAIGRQGGQRQTGADRPAVDQHGTGAAHADAAPLADAEELELAAQHIEQRMVRRHGQLVLEPVDLQADE